MARASSHLRAAVGWLVLLAFLASSCQRYPASSSSRASQSRPAKTATSKRAAATEEAAPPVRYSSTHDDEIKEILNLATQRKWEEAEIHANALIARDPQDPAAQRLLTWVRQQRELRREQALEDKIREIDANNSVFNPTIPGLLRERKDRGLPPRKDVRDAIEQIQSTPYVPENFGRTNYVKGLLFDFESVQGRMAKVLEKEISIHLDNATLETIIFNVGQAEGINFVADKSLPAFQQKLSVNMNRVKLSEFLRYVSRNLDLQFQVGTDLIYIVDGKDRKKLFEETRFYRLRKGFVLPAEFGPPEAIRTETRANNVVTVTEVQKMAKFVNDLAPKLPSIEHAITNFFAGSKYYIDYERNIIIAKGTPEELEVMDGIVQEFDKPIQQILIEARFITVSEASFLKLGIAWETGRDLLTTARESIDYTNLGIGDVGIGLQESKGNILSRRNLSATLTAIQQSGESQVLSAPRLTVINNLPATIADGKVQYYYEEYQVKQTILERRSTSSLLPAGKPVKITSGVNLHVLASIGGDGRTVFLALNPQVNQDVQLVTFATVTDRDDTGKVVSSFDIRLPESRTQELSTRAVVRSGQTVVLGGVLEREQTTFVESVPVLGNIPIIGAAFRRRVELDKPRYLLIFVTATVVSETGEFLIYDEEDLPPTWPGSTSPSPTPPPAATPPAAPAQ
ncbi:MAG: type II secretion system protein GspD [Verrucomicrobia bacterium]|nr:type II secretion system protein GspD [Verrucomicrobiota bacterium]